MVYCVCTMFFFFSSRRRHTRCGRDWSSDVCSSICSMSSLSGPTLVLAKELIEHGERETVLAYLESCLKLEIGRASCRERVEISVGGGSLKKKGKIAGGGV